MSLKDKILRAVKCWKYFDEMVVHDNNVYKKVLKGWVPPMLHEFVFKQPKEVRLAVATFIVGDFGNLENPLVELFAQDSIPAIRKLNVRDYSITTLRKMINIEKDRSVLRAVLKALDQEYKESQDLSNDEGFSRPVGELTLKTHPLLQKTDPLTDDEGHTTV